MLAFRERMEKLKAQFEEQLEAAQEENALRLAGVEGEAKQVEAAARHEGEARCATVQVRPTCVVVGSAHLAAADSMDACLHYMTQFPGQSMIQHALQTAVPLPGWRFPVIPRLDLAGRQVCVHFFAAKRL